MKQFLLWTGALLTLASAALAAPPKEKGKKNPTTPTTISCAVMKGDMVNIKQATAKHMYADYKGNRYFFCCAACPTAFKQNPQKYAKNAHIPTPKAAKSSKKG
ncbi:MAG TPA: YHS domain-containing protein [Chthonomonadaceae bacterium]|nr:YHS domain-containing protein [Chthonomonadaceae bacterium]